MKLFAVIAASAILTSCSTKATVPTTAIPTPSSTACTPAPLPAPQVLLVNPMPNATGVPTSTTSITVSTDGTVTAIGISPAVGGTMSVSSTGVGTPSPTGADFVATLPAALAPNTTYTIAANVTLDPGNCPQTFVVSAGSFST